jgi:polar amino acid transport system substrate-binding protein
MKKVLKNLLILIVIINFIGIIMEATTSCNSKVTRISNLREKDRLETIKEKGLITVIGPPKERPFFVINPETNEKSGIDADIINEIAKRLGVYKIEIKEETFANLLEKFNADDSVDVAVGGIFITPESEKLVAFTKPLYKETEVVIVPKYSKINFMNDLKNAVVGVEKGTIFEDLAKKWKENNLVKEVLILESTEGLFNDISSGKIDAGLVDSIIMNYHLLKEKEVTLRILKDYKPDLQGTMGIAVKKNDISLLNALNKTIDEMKADGTLYSILVDNGMDKNNMIMK